MDKQIVGKINGGRFKFFLAITGGGTSFIGDYITMGGASKVLIGAHVPYHQKAFDKFIRGQKVDRYASSEGARKLAVASFRECLDAGVPPDEALGVGASCSIASTSPEREGRKHRFYVATHKQGQTTLVEMVLNQGRTRLYEEVMINNLILERLAVATEAAKQEDYPPFCLNDGEVFDVQTSDGFYLTKEVSSLLSGQQSIVCPTLLEADKSTLAIYSGSWNPLHDGHKAIHALAEKILNVPVFMEFSVNNTDKGLVDYLEVWNRVKQIKTFNYMISNASYFRSKVNALRDAGFNQKIVFVVGYDTWVRIWDRKYCLNNSIGEEEDFFAHNNVKFLVFGRGEPFRPLVGEGLFTGLGECFRIKDARAEQFQMDISSSDLRKSQP
jgi:hypothetical protein